ncbi:adenosine deaminase 2-like [Chrysoperla carnea]|uniref:adenosine deaminase 2-like n=1 Tax=Chrysoperla carnea TaxID=189513 RepID=UPI001D07DACB|nr:adenosine deaminase 2-like [Chrysoperla carnea]
MKFFSSHATMAKQVILLQLLYFFHSIVASLDVGHNVTYLKSRDKLTEADQLMHLGNKLKLNEKETIVNNLLMKAKHGELHRGLIHPVSFLPSSIFLKAKPFIEKSEVFQIIKRMPKGALLRSHIIGMVSTAFLMDLTYMDNLFICFTNYSKAIRFKFAINPPNSTVECGHWDLLNDLRLTWDYNDILWLNAKIESSFTLIVNKLKNLDVNAVWKNFQSICATLNGFLGYRPLLEKYLYQVFEECINDKILHLEFSGTLPETYELDGKLYSELEIVGIYQTVAKLFQSKNPDFSVKFIYAPNRFVNGSTFDQYLKTVKSLHKYNPDFMSGFDLVGQEDLGVDLLEFADKLSQLKYVNFYFQAGETNWNGMTDLNLFDAVLLGAKRIGHGYGITKHPILMDFIQKNKIAIEVNPISNQIFNLVKDLRNHPAVELFARDYPVVITNDVPNLWGANGLSYDFYEAFMAFTSYSDDIRVLKQLGINSILYSAMSKSQKSRAMDLFNKQWYLFIDEMINSYIK